MVYKDVTKYLLKASSPFLAFALVSLFCSSIEKLDARGTAQTKLVISFPRLSPAVAALEDSIKTWGAETKTQRPDSTIKLMTGKSGADLVTMVRTPRVQPNPAAYLAQISLGGRLVVSLSEVKKAEPVRLAGMRIRQPEKIPVVETVPMVALNAAPIPTRYREEVSVSEQQQIVRELAMQDWRQPSLEESAQKLVKRDNTNSVQSGVRQYDGILVASPTPPPSVVGPMNSAIASTPAPAGPKSSISWAGASTAAAPPAKLSGSIQLVGGLAMTDPKQEIVVFRQMEGLSLERARVWMNEGRFEIAVRSTRGRLIGQLRDAKGRALGSGEIRINQSGETDNLSLKISPVVAGARVEVLSAHSYDLHEQTVTKSQVWLLGSPSSMNKDRDGRFFTEDGLHTGSSYIAQATADNHWGTLVVGLAGQETHARLFPNKMMDALLGLTLGSGAVAVENQNGVIWGRIVNKGAPITGATVEMAGDHRNTAHYFNSMLLPDRFADSTGENGTFAFVGVTPGIQSVRVIYHGESFPAQVIPVERGNVSYLEFEIGQSEAVPFAIYDPMDSSKEINAMVRFAGDETSELDVQGRGQLRVPVGSGLMTLDVDAGEPYELTRYTVPRNVSKITVPTVRRDWLMNLVARKRINLSGGVGLAVGFGIEGKFTVQLETRGQDNTADIVYFDNNGLPLFSDEGVAGGGFAIFNVPLGMQTVVINTESSAVMTEVIVATPEAANVILPNN